MGQSNKTKANRNYAGFWVRLVAFLTDCVILTVPTWLISFGILTFANIQATPDEDPQTTQVKIEILQFSVQFIMGLSYFWLLQTWMSGTPGKRIFGLRLVSQNMGRASYGQTLVRWLMTFPGSLVLFGGYITIGVSEKKQGWHDKVAKTLVVHQHSLTKKARQRHAA